MSFSDWSDNKNKKKKKSYNSFSEYSNAKYGVAEDDDIAPVKEESEERTWFKKSEGNWWETILGSGTDVTEHGTAGFLGIGEKLLDAGATLGALMNRQSMMQAAESEMMFNAISGKKDDKVLDRYLGIQDEVEKGTAEFVEKDLYDEEEIAKAIISDNARKIGIDSERHSVFGEKSDELAMSAGQLGGQLLADTILPGSGMAVMGASAFGSEAESAFRNGASFDEAVLASTISAGAEMLTEKIGGVKFGGKTLTDVAFGKLSNVVTGKFAKALLSAGKIATDASAEAVEEIISGYMSAWGQKLTYMDDKEIEELFSKEDALDAAIGGFVLGGAFGGIETAISGRDPASGLTKHEQTVVDKVVNDTIAEKETNGKKLTDKEKSKIRESVVDQMEKGQIDIDTIESVLGGDTYKAYKETVDSEDALKNELAELRKMKSGDMNDLQTSRMNELKEMNLDDTTKRDGLRKNLDDVLSPMLNGSKLTESYRERERRGQAFEADLSKYTGKKREAVERAVKSGVLNNTYRSHELVDVLSEIEATKGISFDYTNNEKLKESGFAVEGKTVNGFANKSKGAVTLNVQSAKAWESVVGHEITHVLEGTEAYNELRNALYAYAESKGELESRRAYLNELYQNMDADVEAELTADLVGDYLFTDKDFVSKLTGNRTLFQKIYDEIKYLWNVATGKEKTEIEKVKAEFDRVWKEYSNNNETIEESSESREYGDADVQYSIREEAPPKETGIAYKVFYVKDGKLYPPMVANPDGADTPMGVWLNADVGTAAPPSKTGRAQVKAGGKGTQGGSGSLAFRPGWHLGDLPRASQFDRVNPETGKKELFPENFVWAEVEYAKDVDYQEEAMSYGYTDNGKFRHAYAGLPRLPENGYYRYRTNPKPDTVPWVITGAMKVNRLLSDAEVNEILEANGVPAVHRKGGDVGLDKFGFDEKGQVQYSISDSEGNQLSKEQREYFADSKIRDENGNLKVMYHGTPSGDFTVFRDGTYFTENKWYADLYQNPGASSLNSRKTVTNPKTYKVYLDIKKPFDIADAEARDIYINEYIKGGNAVGINPYMSDAEYAKIDYIDWTEGEDLREFLVDNGYDYDGLVLDEGAVGGYGDDVKYRGKSYVTFSPEQVKDVDNKNPTSDPDIRFSLSNSVEETKDLMALHNLQASELIKTLELGGLPMPSIAVIKDTMSHEEYGDVSLILPKEAIDPQANKDNKVYGGDAWTPTYPRIEYKPNEKVAKKIRDKYYGLANNIGYDEVRPLYNYVNDLENTLNRDGGESSMLQKLYEDTGMMNVYLQDSGRGKVETITHETVTKISEAEAEMHQFFIDALGYDFVAAMKAPEGVRQLTHTSAYLDQHDAEIREAYKRYFMEVHGFTQEEANNALSNATKTDLMKIMLGAYRFTQNKGVTVKTETDYEATEKAIRAKAADGYKEWVDGLFKGIEEKSGIRNNQDYYTRSGDPRSWDALHWENTLENVVKVMKGQDETGVGSFSPFNTLFGASHKRYDSIQDIKADSGRLGEIDQDKYDSMKDSFSERFAAIAASIKDPNERNQFIATDTAAEQIIEAVRTRKTKTGILNHLKSLNSSATMQTVDDVLSLVSDIANMPTGYFEAKPQRAVSLDEVGVFVIPRNADVKLKQELLNRGYSIAEYDPDVEGDRQKVVNQFEEYKFSLSNVGEESAPVGTPLRELALDGDVAPVGENVAPAQKAPSLADIPVLPDEELEGGTYEAIKPSGEMVAEAPLPNEIRPMTEEEANAIQDEKAKADAAVEGLPKSRKQLHKNIINDMKATFSSGGYDLDDVLSKAKDLSTFATVDNTPQRVMEKALGYKEGQVLADLTVNKVAQNETKGIKWLNSFTDRKNGLLAQISNQYRIKPGSKESAAAQMYAEGFYVNDNNDIVAYGDAELAKDFPDASVQNRIKGLASDPRIRQIYDETLEAINKSRARNAYPEIQRLENYFLHFRAMDDTFSKLGIPFNPNDIRAKDLPTDLNGVTADLKPGQPYFASSMHRKGKRTSFDLLGGLERYLTSAKNQIYHIDDIQNLRALRNYIADTYGQAKGLEVIDLLSEEEAQDRIEKVYDAHLSTFAKFLNEEANVLAGKTALIDRGLEGIIGRRGMTFLDTVNRQVGSNMVGYSASSAIVNFDALPRALAKTNKFDFVKGFAQTVSNRIGSIFGKSDSFSENSPVIIRRKGADRFYRTPFQKASDGGYVLMGVVDDISTEIIARAKYNELTRKGMDEQTAHFETDKWVSKLMGDRSLGQQPLIFNSKMLGLVTKFQLEVRNNLDSQFYDTIQEAKVSSEDIENALARNAKTAAKVTSTFVQLAVAQHVFGKAFESIAGYNPSFDIISVLATLFGFDDEEDDEDTVLDNIEQGFLELLEDLPYTSVLTGGRIPIANALPVTELIKGTDSYGNEKSRWETLGEAAPYYILPGGYGQIKKTAAGWNMFSDDHPVTGSYTDSGSLRFPVEDTPLNRVQAAIFGQYASKNAREYFDNGYAPLSEKQIQEYIDVDMPIKEYREYREGLKKQETLEDKFDYISGLDLPVAKKNILINNEVDRKDAVDLEGYEDFGSLEEFDFATKNPEKYAFAKSVGGYSAYQTYSDALYDIKADKDESGKSINGSRKEKVLNYINNLDADYYTKIILWKSEYPSDDNYNREIVDYINNRSDLSYEDKVAVLAELGFRVTADGQIYSD